MEWKWWLYCSDKPRQSICFCLVYFLLAFLSVNQWYSLFCPLFGSMLSPAVSWSSATQKIGVSYRLHPFPGIPLQGVIWRFNSQKQLLHTLSLPLIPTSRLLQQDNSVFPTCHYPLSNLLCITLIMLYSYFELQTGQKNRCRLQATPIFSDEINVIFRR